MNSQLTSYGIDSDYLFVANSIKLRKLYFHNLSPLLGTCTMQQHLMSQNTFLAINCKYYLTCFTQISN